MDVLIYLIPAALFLGLLGLVAFFWSLKSGQFEDLDGAAERILLDDEDLAASRKASARPSQTEPTHPPQTMQRQVFAPPCH
jgi:cbb3-type cytochrome oxidase maturation protein